MDWGYTPSGKLLIMDTEIGEALLEELLEALQMDFPTYQALLASEGKDFLSRLRTVR